MKKKNNKGFMLTEALVVSILITTVLTFLYVHFKKVSNKVNDSFKFDTIQSMYSLDSIKGYIEQENYSSMVASLGVLDYVDISDCSIYYFSNTDFCKAIFSDAGVEKIFIVEENMYKLIKNKSFEKDYKAIPLGTYVKSIKYDKTDGYRLIGYFKDGSFANVKVFDGDSFYLNIASSCNATASKKYTVRYIDSSINSNLKDDFIGTAGCGTTIDANDYIDDVQDECYVVGDLTNNSLMISDDESSNILTIPYNRLKVNVTINYLDMSNNTLMPSTVKRLGCGLQFNPSESIIQKSGYLFDHASSDTVTLSSNDISINLYYKREGE